MRIVALPIVKLSILALGSTTIHRCYGRRGGFHSTHQFGKIRGGDSSYNGYQNSQYGRSDLPPSLPNYGDDETHSRGHEQPMQQEQYRYNSQQQENQQYQEQGRDLGYKQQVQYYSEQDESYRQQNPSLPTGAYGIDHGQGPLPHPSNYGQQQYPSLPDDVSMFQDEDEPEAMDIDTAFGGGEGANDNRGGMDLSGFNKEYILKGLAKLYKKKILPLEISSRYGHFHSPPLSPADFVAPPQVLLLGQYR